MDPHPSRRARAHCSLNRVGARQEPRRGPARGKRRADTLLALGRLLRARAVSSPTAAIRTILGVRARTHTAWSPTAANPHQRTDDERAVETIERERTKARKKTNSPRVRAQARHGVRARVTAQRSRDGLRTNLGGSKRSRGSERKAETVRTRHACAHTCVMESNGDGVARSCIVALARWHEMAMSPRMRARAHVMGSDGDGDAGERAKSRKKLISTRAREPLCCVVQTTNARAREGAQRARSEGEGCDGRGSSGGK